MPAEADGKAAICPACQKEFVASAERSPSTSDRPPTPSDVPKPKRGKPDPIRKVSIESILGDTQTIYADRRRPILLPFLIPSILVVAGLVFPLAYLSDLVANNKPGAVVWTLVLLPWFLLVATYAFWFALNLGVDVCNAGPDLEPGKRERIRSWFLPDPKVFLALFLILTALAAVFAALVGMSIAIANAAENVKAFEIRLLMFVVAFFGSLVALTLITMRFWPLIPMAMDGRFGTPAVRRCLAITGSNLMTSFLLVIASFFALGLGFGLFGLGLPLAVPLVALSLIVGYRLIEGKRIPAFEREEF